MSIRFTIKNLDSKVEKEGNVFIRYTGSVEPFTQGSERDVKEVGINPDGTARLVFNTGLEEKQVQFFKWFSDDEKEILVKEILELKPIISEYYGGDAMITNTNKFFWKEPSVNKIAVSNTTSELIFDTKNVPSALLYLSICSGAFMDTIAPNKEWAERNQIPHYIILEKDETFEDEDDITKSDAHGALSELRKDASPEALFILAWCIQYDTRDYGAYLKSTPLKELINYHIKYIDGKLSLKKKRSTPKTFIEYAEKWKAPKTRELLYVEAYIKAGEYYNFIKKAEKKFNTIDGTALGNTVADAINIITKPQHTEELEKLRDLVEAKWKE